jgi:DNA-binding NtrC family response regulator
LKTERSRFREDLYHRLCNFDKVPSLNERREDIQVDLAFADKIASEQGNAVKKFSGDAVKLLQNTIGLEIFVNCVM